MSKKELQQRELTLKDLPKITKFLKQSGIKDKLWGAFFNKPEPLVTSWGQLRAEADLTKEQMDILKLRSQGNLDMAVRMADGAEHLVPKEVTQLDLMEMAIELIFDMLDQEDKYNMTLELLADLYDTTVEDVETRTVAEVYGLIEGVIKDESFPKP